MSFRPIFYDTETTGLNTEKNEIIEIGAYDPIKKKSFCKFVNPGCPIPKESIAICNITDEMVADADDFSVVIKEFIEFCEGKVVLIAHNNDRFDLPMLKSHFKRHQMQMPENWKFFDSLKWARRYRPDLPKHSLQFLRESYGIVSNNAHRALDDVIVLYKVFIKMTDCLPIETIYNLMAKSQENVSIMTFGKYKDWPLERVPKHYIRWLSENGVFDKPENKSLLEQFRRLGLTN